MAFPDDRYWVSSGTWDATNTGNWSLVSGGVGGASVPTSANSVFFDNSSGAVSIPTSTTVACLDFTSSSSLITFTLGVLAVLNISGSMVLSAGTTISTGTSSPSLNFIATTTGKTLNVNGASVNVNIVFNGVGGEWTLGSALSIGTRNITVTNGTLNTSTYNVTAGALLSTNSNTRTINLGSSTVTLSAATPIDFTTATGLTFTAGTLQINCSSSNPTFSASGQTFYNVSFTNTGLTDITLNGSNTFNNLTITARSATTPSVMQVSIFGDQTINGTFTISASGNALVRTFLRSSAIGTTRTLTCAAVSSLRDIDFRDITIAGAAAPISGTRFGNCQGTSGITFSAAKTVFFRSTGAANWGATGSWSATSGGTADVTQFPLAQDTAIFPAATYPASGIVVTMNVGYNVGTIDMSLRTTNTMTFALGTRDLQIYGDLKTGTGITYTGTSSANLLTFCGRNTQTITSATKTIPRSISIDSPGGTVRLLDALTLSDTNSSTVVNGTWDLNGYPTTLQSNISVTGTATRGITFGGATLKIGGGVTGTSTIVWDATNSTNLTLDGTGTISIATGGGAAGKTFAGGGYQNYPTVFLSDSDVLFAGFTITGSNKFFALTNNTLNSNPATGVKFAGGTVNEFTDFSLNSGGGTYIPLKSTNTTQATLRKPTAWVMGQSSQNIIGNTGLTFGGPIGTLDYLQVSYINGIAGGNSYTDSIMESITVGDLNSTLYAYLASLYENFSPDDSRTQQASYLSPINEDFSPADAATTSVQIYINQTEDFSPADLSALSFQFFVSQSEDTSVLDTPASTAQLFESQTEDFSSSDVSALALLISLSQTENINSADSAAMVVQFVVSRAEGFTSADVASVGSAFFQSITENTSAADLATAVRNLFFALNEDVSSANAQTISLQFLQLVQENLNLQEFAGGPAAFNVSLVENFNMLDGPFVSGGWIKVDDTQTPSWQNVGNSQTPAWDGVETVQTPAWEEVVT